MTLLVFSQAALQLLFLRRVVMGTKQSGLSSGCTALSVNSTCLEKFSPNAEQKAQHFHVVGSRGGREASGELTLVDRVWFPNGLVVLSAVKAICRAHPLLDDGSQRLLQLLPARRAGGQMKICCRAS